MTKISELKEEVAALMEAATEKEDIDRLSKMSLLMDDAEKEYQALVDENKELLKDYKDVIKHVSVDRPSAPSREISAEAPKFEDFFK